ncbi:MAG: hypothetical protein AAF198_13335 [Pseudomonadota bacterium]
MKMFLTALTLGAMALASTAHANPIFPDVTTQFPQDGAFVGKGLVSSVVKDAKS